MFKPHSATAPFLIVLIKGTTRNAADADTTVGGCGVYTV